MTLFVYEHITATMPASDTSLYREGRAMRDALIADLDAIEGIEVVPFRAGDSFDECVRKCDAVWLVAPEFDDSLGRLADEVVECGKTLLGPSPSAIRLTANKFELFKHWQRTGVPTPMTVPCHEWPSVAFPFVVKPIDGCGSTATTFVNRAEGMPAALNRAAEVGYEPDRLIVQPFSPGRPASVAFLIGKTSATPLVPTFQYVVAESHFAYDGGELPIPHDLAVRAIQLGQRAVNCVPGLFGYVGVDLILGGESDGSQDVAIEINPRLTTSYVGLRALAEFNIAEAAYDLCLRNIVPIPKWKPVRMRFTPEGVVRRLEHFQFHSR